MTQSYSDLKRIFDKDVGNVIFTCKDHSQSKSHKIDISSVLDFYKNYCETCYNKDFGSWKKNPILTISEKVDTYVPVISEFVFGFDKTAENLFNEELSNHIIVVIQSVIQDIFKISENNNELICIYLKSETWIENDKKNIRLRFQFPFCRTTRDILNKVFRDTVIKKLRETNTNKLFLNHSPIGDWDNHLQEIDEFVTLYGSTKNPEFHPPVLYVGTYGDSGDSGICMELKLSDIYTFTDHSFIRNEHCNMEDIEAIEEDCDIEDDESFAMYLFPMFMSIYFHHGVSIPRQENLMTSENKLGKARARQYEEDEEDDDEETKSDYDLCLELVEYLDPTRFDDETSFMDIGRALYSSTMGGFRGLNAWIKLSSKSNKFDKKFCREHYESFENDRVTVRTIGWYYKLDDQESYHHWHNRWCRPTFMQALNKDHILVAEAFYKKNWLSYIYDGEGWYEFRRNRLVKIKELSIKKIMLSKFIPDFDIINQTLLDNKLKMTERKKSSKSRCRDIEEAIENIAKLRKLLRNEAYISSILKSIRTFFYYEDVNRVMNKNPNLLGCSNCVIELTNEKAIKREGKPEDFITKRIGVSYRSDYTWEHPDIKALKKYLMQVFPNKEVRDFMKKDFASYQYRRNSEKYFRMWIGDTNGSKSILQKIIKKWLGDYYCDVPSKLYSTSNKDSSGPTPELAQTEDAAVAFSAEPDSNVPWSGALIKKFTGGDSYYARKNHDDGGSIEATFKSAVAMNIVPDISDMDEATKERCLFIPFEARWVKPSEPIYKEIKETFEEQVEQKLFKIDPTFDKNIPKLASALCWMSVQNYALYKKEGILQRPAYLQKFLDDYWSKEDPYVAFINECLEEPKNADGLHDLSKYVTATDIYPIYKKWFKSNYPNHKSIEKSKFTTFMSSGNGRLGKQRSRRWYGWSIKVMDADNVEI